MLTPRKYQEDIYNTCKDNNTLVILPTGLGENPCGAYASQKIC